MAIDREKNRLKVRDDATWAAFETLVGEAERQGLVMADLTGHMTGVKFYRDTTYAFAFQSNPAHLNFYIRKQAQKRWGPMAERAKLFGIVRERADEIQIHVRSAGQAQALADWLFALP